MEISNYQFLKKKREKGFQTDENFFQEYFNGNIIQKCNKTTTTLLNSKNFVKDLIYACKQKEQIDNLIELLKFKTEVFVSCLEANVINFSKLSEKDHLDIYYKERI